VTYDGPDGPVDSGSMVQGQSWSTRFGQAGTYRYYCRFHPGMTGTIVVASSG
jgi:plastocyanin